MRNNSKGFAVVVRETLIVILSECEESAAVVRKAVRCHPGNRFFTRCHVVVSRLSHKAFLLPFRMTTDDKRYPEAMSKTCCCDEENHKTSSKANVKDCCRSEEGGKTSS